MRETLGWICAIVLAVSLAGGLIGGAVMAVKDGDPVGIVAFVCIIFVALAAGASWGLGL